MSVIVNKPIKQKRIKHDYIDNKKFYSELCDFIKITEQAREEGVPECELPPPNDYITKSMYDISVNMGRRPNFSGYTFIEDMVMDGFEDALRRIRNFNPDEPKKNAFGYVSKIIWQAFIRRIQKESKQQYIKYTATIDGMDTGMLFYSEHYDNSYKPQMSVEYEAMTTYIKEYDEKLEEKKAKNRKNPKSGG